MDSSPENIWGLVTKVYTQAQQIGATFKTPTRSEIMKDELTGIMFLIRTSESLQEKSKQPKKVK